MEESKQSLQIKVNALNRDYIAATTIEPEGPQKDERLRRLQDAIIEYEKRIRSF